MSPRTACVVEISPFCAATMSSARLRIFFGYSQAHRRAVAHVVRAQHAVRSHDHPREGEHGDAAALPAKRSVFTVTNTTS
jgi:hypothetical protein